MENSRNRVGITESVQEFSKRLDLPFSDYLLLSRALTHRSYINEHPEAIEDNERLEFLGDAVLDFLVGAWIYNHFPEMNEGEMTKLRSALVRTEQLALFANHIQIGGTLRLGRGEDEGGGRNRVALLCGAFEALIGALYLNAGLDAVQYFIHPMLAPAVDQIFTNHKDQDPKSVLQEWIQSQGFDPPRYQTVSTSGPEHNKTFAIEVLINEQVYGQGDGHSKQSAEKAAAKAALEYFGVIK